MARRNSVNNSPATAEAIEILCAKHVHQCLFIPANDTLGHGRLRVTYATTSNFDDESLPVALFFHPMFGGRYSLLAFNNLAKEKGVRIIAPDRPGMGGSTPVPITMRMETWLEIIPALLKHLGVEHVHLMAHSAGTMYLLNTLYALRDTVLGSKDTYVGLMTPWVDNEHSKVAIWNVASKLSTGILDNWNGIIKFVNTKVAPSLSWSGGAISSVAGMFQSAPSETKASDENLAKLYGTSIEVAKELERLRVKFYFAEDTTAGNEDAKLCLKMGGTKLWGACDDYLEFTRDLVKDEKERLRANARSPGLRMRAFFAESDVMIGKGGQTYFEQCWAQEGVPGPIDYHSEVLPGTDHETVFIDGEKSALPTIFTDVVELSRKGSDTKTQAATA